MTKNERIAQLEERLAAAERRIADLEARPRYYPPYWARPYDPYWRGPYYGATSTSGETDLISYIKMPSSLSDLSNMFMDNAAANLADLLQENTPEMPSGKYTA